MRIAVTGASGFIGTELLEYIGSHEDEISIIGLTRGGSAQADSSSCGDMSCEWRATDFSEESLRTALAGADVVIHLAGVRGTTSNPDDYVINEQITENILKAMVSDGVGRIVFASTISVYDDVDLIPWGEDTPLKGRTMYGNSKIRCEELIQQYAEESGFGYGIVRIAQVLGAGERRRAMMNVFLDTAAAGGEIKVIGKSVAKRQYLYVKDLVRILTKLAAREPSDRLIVNAGMPNAYSNLEIAQIVNRVYSNPTPINYDDATPETIRSSCMDITVLREQLGYEPLDMEAAVAEMKA